MGDLKSIVIDRLELLDPQQARPLLSIEKIEMTAGSIYGLIGTNLSGRSVFLRYLGGGALDCSVSSGGCAIKAFDANGEQTDSYRPEIEGIFLASDPKSNLSHLTTSVADEIELHSEVAAKASNSWTNCQISESLERLELAACLERDPQELSGGQTAALSLLCGIIMNRLVLCVDDGLMPQLDGRLRAIAWEMLRKHSGLGHIVLVADNQYDYMAEYADATIVFDCNRASGVMNTVDAFNLPACSRMKTLPPVASFYSVLKGCSSDLPTSYNKLLERLKPTLCQQAT